MTHRPRLSTLRGDAVPLTLVLTGLLALSGAAIITFTTPTRYTEHRPTGPRLEVTGTYRAPRPVTVLVPDAVIGDVCSPTACRRGVGGRTGVVRSDTGR